MPDDKVVVYDKRAAEELFWKLPNGHLIRKDTITMKCDECKQTKPGDTIQFADGMHAPTGSDGYFCITCLEEMRAEDLSRQHINLQ